MIYGSINQTRVPDVAARQFPTTDEFGYELMQLHLRAVCNTMRERDSIYKQAKDAHQYVAMLGPRSTKSKRWYGIYW